MTGTERVNNIRAVSEEMLKSGLKLRVPVIGTSMYPYLRHGDYAIIEYVEINELSVGDIIACRINDNYVVHRLIRLIKKNGKVYLKCKGDSCYRFDKQVSVENYFGRVNSFERNRKKNISARHGRKSFNYLIAKFSPITTPVYMGVRKIHKFTGK